MDYGVRWLIQDYAQTWLNATCQVTFNTDRPVHAWLRWTDQQPDMHLQSMERRGLRMWTEPYYCFTQHQEIEQEEAGDTTSHTFIWPDWYTCLWRWFLFWATADGVTTPTQWGIFKKHYVGPETVTLLVYANGTYTDIPFPTDKSIHWSRVRAADTTWVPPNGGGYYGRFDGAYVHVRIYDGYQWFRDTFKVHTLPPNVTEVLKVTAWMLLGKIYVYGRAKTAIITYGTLFEGTQINIAGNGLHWYETEYLTNPLTGLPWTFAEVNALEAGLSLAHAGTFGRAICDQVLVEVTHRPAFP